MNLFNEAIYASHLEHSQKGQTWGKHKYLYITETGRYVYPEDVANGRSQSDFRSQQINDQMKSAHRGVVSRGKAKIARSRQINDQIKSAHVNATSSKMELTPGSELKKRAESRAAAKTSGSAAGANNVSTPAERNTITIKKTTTTTTPKTEEKKTETTATSKDGEKYKNMSEETKQWLMKNADKDEKKKEGSSKKGSGGKKKSGGSSKKGSSKASTATEEASKMGLSDDDLKKMEVNTQATDREEVLKNIALRVIRGDYGNGADRQAKLGNYYDEVQKRVNELMKSGQIQREGQAEQQTSKNTEQKTQSNTTKSSTEKTETQKKNAEEISVAKQLAKISGMKNSATLNLVKMYKQDSKSKKFQEELDSLAEGDEKQRQRMLRILGYMKHSDLEEGDFLMHWGKKHRSGRYKFGSGNRPYQHEARNHSWRDRRTMSDEDLEKALIRARKENDLYNAERNNRSVGQKFVEDVMTSVGKQVLTTAGKGALLWAGKNFAIKVLDNPELGEFIARGGPKKEKNK